MMLFLQVAYVLCACISAAPSADEITNLPGWKGSLPTRQYSGYLSLKSGSNLHYWFVSSEKSPSTDPTIVWFNGGPGCSSLDGFIYEMGPFIVNDDLTLSTRPGRWNQVANVVYIESPVGVGFSYSDSRDYACDDDRTAKENKEAISLLFTDKFPELINNPFFLTGESYAGVYVPVTAEAILNGQKDGTYKGASITGIAVGNGCSGTEVGICSMTPQATYTEWSYLAQTPFVSQDLKELIATQCDWEAAKTNEKHALSFACVSLLNQASNEISNVNLYNIYGDCVNGGCGGESIGRGRVPMRSDITVTDPSDHTATRRLQRIVPGGPDACIDSILASAYLNQPSVMAAIHVKPPAQCWSVCSTAPGWTYNSTRQHLPRDTYPYLIQNMYVLIYNGDWDACVPYTDGDLWTKNMGFPVKASWHAWKFTSLDGNTNQVAGYATEYDVSELGAQGSFRFVTVKGGEHMVPESAPAQALEMINRVIAGASF